MPGWEDVRRIAAALPGAEEGTTYRDPAFKVNGKAFVNLSGRYEGVIVLRCPVEEQQLLIRARPDVYYITPHYEGWGGVLLRLDAVDDDELACAVEDAYAWVRGR